MWGSISHNKGDADIRSRSSAGTGERCSGNDERWFTFAFSFFVRYGDEPFCGM